MVELGTELDRRAAAIRIVIVCLFNSLFPHLASDLRSAAGTHGPCEIKRPPQQPTSTRRRRGRRLAALNRAQFRVSRYKFLSALPFQCLLSSLTTHEYFAHSNYLTPVVRSLNNPNHCHSLIQLLSYPRTLLPKPNQTNNTHKSAKMRYSLFTAAAVIGAAMAAPAETVTDWQTDVFTITSCAPDITNCTCIKEQKFTRTFVG